MGVCKLTHAISPISLSLMLLRPCFRLRRARTGKAEVEGSDPPFFLPGAGAGVWRNLHLRHTPWGGRSLPKYPCGKPPEKNPEDLLELCQASVPHTWCVIQA